MAYANTGRNQKKKGPSKTKTPSGMSRSKNIFQSLGRSPGQWQRSPRMDPGPKMAKSGSLGIPLAQFMQGLSGMGLKSDMGWDAMPGSGPRPQMPPVRGGAWGGPQPHIPGNTPASWEPYIPQTMPPHSTVGPWNSFTAGNWDYDPTLGLGEQGWPGVNPYSDLFPGAQGPPQGPQGPPPGWFGAWYG